MSTEKKKGKPSKPGNPLVAEFLSAAKSCGLNNQELITKISEQLEQSEVSIRFVNHVFSPPLDKILSRIITKTKLQYLTLYSCPLIEPHFYQQLAMDVAKSSITSLTLDFMPAQRDWLIPFFSIPNLETLSLRGNQCITSYPYRIHGESQWTPSVNAFYNAITASSIQTINFFDCHIGDDGARALSNVLLLNTSLRRLCLAGNRITDVGAHFLASALGFLVLHDEEIAIVDHLAAEDAKSRISDEGAMLKKKKGAQKPPQPKKTTRKRGLVLNTNLQLNFDPKAAVMAGVLGNWNKCETNEKGEKVIPGNSTLTTLLLDNNQISKNGAQDLIQMLQCNQTLMHFSVQGNPDIDEEMPVLLVRPDSQSSPSLPA